MTILFVIDDIEISGVTSFVSQYAMILQKQGHTVLIIGQKTDVVNSKIQFTGCQVISLPRVYRFGYLFLWFSYIKALADLFSKYKVDLIHLTTPITGFFTLTYPATWKIKRLVTFCGAYHLEMLSQQLKIKGWQKVKLGIKLRTIWFMQYLTLLFSETIIVTSIYSRRLIIKHFNSKLESKIKLIPGYASTKPKITPSIKSERYLRLLNFGRSEPRKGIDLLLGAAKLLKQKSVPFHLIISSPIDNWFNTTSFLEYERLNLFDSVQFVHRITPEQKYKLLYQADLFIMPSKDLETFGMSMLDALSFGVPVIGTPTGAIPEILEQIDKRLICKETSSQSIFEKILWFQHLSSTEKQKLRYKSIQICKTVYSQRRIGKLIMHLYNNINLNFTSSIKSS